MMQRFGPPKKNKTVLDTGQSLCTDQMFDFVQEMGDLKLAPQGVGVTLHNPFLVLIYDAKTWYPPPPKKSTVSDTGLSLCTDQMIDFVPEMGDLKLAL